MGLHSIGFRAEALLEQWQSQRIKSMVRAALSRHRGDSDVVYNHSGRNHLGTDAVRVDKLILWLLRRSVLWIRGWEHVTCYPSVHSDGSLGYWVVECCDGFRFDLAARRTVGPGGEGGTVRGKSL